MNSREISRTSHLSSHFQRSLKNLSNVLKSVVQFREIQERPKNLRNWSVKPKELHKKIHELLLISTKFMEVCESPHNTSLRKAQRITKYLSEILKVCRRSQDNPKNFSEIPKTSENILDFQWSPKSYLEVYRSSQNFWNDQKISKFHWCPKSFRKVLYLNNLWKIPLR